MQPFRYFLFLALLCITYPALGVEVKEKIPGALHFYLSQYPLPISISPDGKLALYKTRHERDFELSVVELASQKKLYSSHAVRTQLALAWKDDSKQIAYLAVGPDGKKFQLRLWDLASGKVTAVNVPLTEDASIPLRWQPGSSRLAMFAGNIHRGNLLIIDLSDPEKPVITDAGSALPAAYFSWSLHGDFLAFATAATPEAVTIVGLQKDAPVFKTVSFTQTRSHIFDVAWSADSSKLAVNLIDPQEEYAHLAIVDVATSRELATIHTPFDISSPFWLDWTEKVVFEVNHNGLHELWMTDATGNAGQVTKDSSHHILGSMPNKHRVYDYVTQPVKPPQINAFDPVAKATELVADSPKIKMPAIMPRVLTLKAKDGNPVPVYIWEPPAQYHGKRAGLIWLHGGPDQQGLPVWDARIQWLANQGITFVMLNYRGSIGYGISFKKQVDLAAESLDILAARDYLTQNGIPIKNIILAGYSHGGTVAAKALSVEPDGFGYLVLISNIVDIENYCPGTSHLLGVYGFHGEFDNFTSPQKANQAFMHCFGAQATGVAPHWQTLSNEGHNFHQTHTWSDIDSTIAGFVKAMD